MAAVGGLAIGMCIVFGVFVLLLLAELCYVFYWKRRRSWRRISGVPSTEIFSAAAERSAANFSFTREVGLVGAGENSADPELLAKLFPFGSSSSCNSGLYMQGVLGGPRLLFTIDEETKEEMEYEEPVDFHNSNAFPSIPQPQPKLNNFQHQKQQWQYGYSIGMIKQQQQMQQQKVKKYEESRYHWKSASPSPQPMSSYSDSPFQRSASFRSFTTSEYSSSSPANPRYSLYAGSFPSSSCSSSPPRPSASSSFPSSCSASPWRNYDLAESHSRNDYEDVHSISNHEEDPCVFYDAEADRFSSRRSTEFGTPASSRRSTEFGTPGSSPSHLLGNYSSNISSTSPPLTPPLTPIRAPLAAYSIPLFTRSYSFSAARNPKNPSPC